MRHDTGRNWTRRSIEELCAQYLKEHGGGGGSSKLIGRYSLLNFLTHTLSNNMYQFLLVHQTKTDTEDFTVDYMPILIHSVLGTITFGSGSYNNRHILNINNVSLDGFNFTGTAGTIPPNIGFDLTGNLGGDMDKIDCKYFQAGVTSLVLGEYFPINFNRGGSLYDETVSDADGNGVYIRCGTCDIANNDIDLHWYKIKFQDLNTRISQSYKKIYNAVYANQRLTITNTDVDSQNFWTAFKTFIQDVMTANNLTNCVQYAIVTKEAGQHNGYWSDGHNGERYKKVDINLVKEILHIDNYTLVGLE